MIGGITPRPEPEGHELSPGARSQLPQPRRVLGWLYLGRLYLAVGVFGAALWTWRNNPQVALSASLILVVSGFVTAASFWYTHLSNRHPEKHFRYGQLAFDAFLVTWVVYLTGGTQSTFAPLYILVICAAAVLLPIFGTLLIGSLASALLLGSGWIAAGPLDFGALLHVALFIVIAFVTGFLGDRLRRTGAALGEMETELHLLRLDTGEILDTIGTGILTVDGEGRLAYINPAATDLLSLLPEQWVGEPVLEVLDRVAHGLGSVIARTAKGHLPIRRFETEPGQENALVLGVSTTLMERSEGETPPVTAIFQDITEKKRMEALRLRTERLEAVAELSASLAHEIKNPLASIRSAVEQITSDRIDAEDADVLKGLVVRESDRLSRLLAEFLDFARVQVTTPQPVDFAALVENVITLVRAHPDAEGRDLQTSFGDGVEHVWVRGAEDLLHRAVLNLVLNAAQWAGEKGQVQVILDPVRSDLLSPALGDSELVRLTVVDSGPGVPEEIVEQIFDPFFTRRAGGTGLGLALVQRTVEAHGGAIFVDNAPMGDRGAMFTLYLPTLPTGAERTGNTVERVEREEPVGP